MKVLFLNPLVAAEHPLIRALQAKGYAVLLPANPQEAWQMFQLHGTSVDLAIVHREDATGKESEQGFKFLTKIKADQAQADLPVIVTSQVWGDAEFAQHQGTPQGANAYLKWPFQHSALISLIEAVFGTQSETVPEAANATRIASSIEAPGMPEALDKSGSYELVLEDASSLFSKSGTFEKSDTSIKLEAPDHEASLSDVLIPTASGISLETPSEMIRASEATSVQVGQEGVELSQSLELSVSSPVETAAAELPAADLSEGLSVCLTGHSSSELSIQEPEQASEATTVQKLQQSPEPDHEAAQEMPYLFQKSPGMAFAQPMGDAVVPGGAAHTPDIETLKKYLLLREQDVAVLSTQLKSTKDQLKVIEETLREERARSSELTHVAHEQKRKIDDFEKEKAHAVNTLQAEVDELRFQIKARADKARLLESQVREAADETERLKDRVRSDIRKIRVREKELENRLEIMKKDSEALISARENKIIELKRKLDLLEFNMDLLQDQHSREKESSVKLRDRLAKAAQVVRVAGGLLDSPGGAAQLAAVLAGQDHSDKDAA